MANFEDRTSPGYRLIAAALIRYAAEAPEVVSMRWVQATEMLKAKRQNEAAELVQ